MRFYNNETPIAILTVAQLKEITENITKQESIPSARKSKQYVHDIGDYLVESTKQMIDRRPAFDLLISTFDLEVMGIVLLNLRIV